MAKIPFSFSRSLWMMTAIAIFLSSFLVITGVVAGEPDQQVAMVKAAREFLDVAQVKYEKGLYDSALQMLKQLQDEYGDVLPAEDAKKAKALMQDVENAKNAKASLAAKLAKCDELVAQKQFKNASVIIDDLKKVDSLDDSQKRLVAEKVAFVSKSYSAYKGDMKHLFSQSVSEFKAGNNDAALEGFKKVQKSGLKISSWGKDSAHYISLINKGSKPECKAEVVKPAPVVSKKCPVAAKTVAVKKVKVAPVTAVATPVKAEAVVADNADQVSDSYIQMLQEKRNRQRDYTRAVVNDSINKAEGYLADFNFAKARSSLSVAYANIDKSKFLLGDSIYSDYKCRLDQLGQRIDQLQNQKNIAEAEQQRIQTEQLQKDIRTNMEQQRGKAVQDYMNNAMAFQREQRYQEALAQIEALLAIDPLNNMALIQKQTLEDILVWREQNEIQKKRYEEELKTLLSADRANIPYTDEMVYSSDWKELVGRRKSDQQRNIDPANLAIYRQLDQVVDLTALTEDTAFSEAIDILKNSVDPALSMIVMWRDLEENAYIEKDTPINVSFDAPIKLKVALQLLLNSVSGGLADLDYAVTDGIIQVATVEALPDKMETRQYDVTELLGVSASFSFDVDTSDLGNQGEGRGGGGGGSSRSSSDDEDVDSTELQQLGSQKADDVMMLIQDSIDPESWYDAGGDGSITLFDRSKLIVRQTAENHEQIEQLLQGLRSSIGQQVAIEARFLVVTENFLERLGIDVDMIIKPGGSWSDITVNQNHSGNTAPKLTGVPGSLAGNDSSTISGTYGTILDDLQVRFLINAIQTHRDAKSLNAPKVSVLSGESAAIRVTTDKSYVSDYDFEDITSSGDSQPTRVIADPEISSLSDGVVLNVQPTITSDKKYVLLRITTSFTTTSFADFPVPSGGETSQDFIIQLPESEIADVRTRVTVPDGGTLLIGGQKLTAEVDTQEGIPVLNKIPFFGRFFENKSEIKDSSILLILVKPTIMLQDEQEEDAIGAMR